MWEWNDRLYVVFIIQLWVTKSRQVARPCVTSRFTSRVGNHLATPEAFRVFASPYSSPVHTLVNDFKWPFFFCFVFSRGTRGNFWWPSEFGWWCSEVFCFSFLARYSRFIYNTTVPITYVNTECSETFEMKLTGSVLMQEWLRRKWCIILQ